MYGGIAEAFYNDIPNEILSKGKSKLDIGLKRIIDQFSETYH